MPCRVDLFSVFDYYDWHDRTFFLYFNSPLVPLMCEAISKLKDAGLPLSEEQEKWYALHEKDDAYREKTGKHLSPFESSIEEELRYFSELEKKSSV